jgi:hypothetical protein
MHATCPAHLILPDLIIQIIIIKFGIMSFFYATPECWTLGLQKGLGISRVAEQLLASQEGPSSVELVSSVWVWSSINTRLVMVELITWPRLGKLLEKYCCLKQLNGMLSMFIVLNVHAPTEDKIDDMKDSFYEKLRCVFNKLPKYHMKILFGRFQCQSR